jgi:Fe-Mn family superoxide dismutase
MTKFTLPPLPYTNEALQPYISKETIDFHYGKHHQTYVNNLNKLIVGTEFEQNSNLEHIMLHATGPLFNNAAQVWNHTFYWHCLTPNGGGEPSGELHNLIVKNFGSFDAFKEQFTNCAIGTFGSGWAWLVQDKHGALLIKSTGNAQNPMTEGYKPLMTCDVWEHAYYIDYRNARADYVNAFWNLVNWNYISQQLHK